MTFTVTYSCPHCGKLVELERDEYLADKAVTPFPFEGWEYAAPDEDYEEADGVKFVCGEDESASAAGEVGKDDSARTAEIGPDGELVDAPEGCGRRFYLSFVKFENGEELDPRRPSEFVEINPADRVTGIRGPRGPRGPGGFWS
ncbi:hypothetical protein [Halegenticoccus soli]|uniref:hypothetical protein n=1 Tax=Halegenticoccus soli TaxID=1985678 RepID=UPI000C6D3487|nr:hypothetical protein [Halegenticoccus soli]